MIGVQIIALKFIVECNTFNVISACAPCIELEKHLKIKFWEELEGLLNSEYTTGRKDFSRGDLNSKDDNWTQVRWPGGVKSRNSESAGNWQPWRDFMTRMKVWFCHGNRGDYGLGEINVDGKSILFFFVSRAFNLIITNTSFRKKNSILSYHI
ncbi:hypothetical protein MTR_4g108110 [Medicago truncatula]|uniref:Uncharacterized protein n=1 Tax=Medicago truncatula TaxID=3880 RepID=G7JQW0_MEDTR|nr:hypothetical protein MTR_4g108110 [Medicago truncatula]